MDSLLSRLRKLFLLLIISNKNYNFKKKIPYLKQMGQTGLFPENKTMILSNWVQAKPNDNIFFNKVTNQQIQRHQAMINTRVELNNFIERMQDQTSLICRLIYFHPKADPKDRQFSPLQFEANYNQHYNSRTKSMGENARQNPPNLAFPQTKSAVINKMYCVYTDRMIQIKQWNKQKIIHTIQGLKKLVKIHGHFKIRQKCICENEKKQIKIWINQNPVCCLPIERVQNQQDMIADFAALLVSRKQKIAKELLDLKYFDQVIEHMNNLQINENKKNFESNRRNNFDAKNRQKNNTQKPRPQINNFYNVFINTDNSYTVNSSLQNSRNYSNTNPYGYYPSSNTYQNSKESEEQVKQDKDNLVNKNEVDTKKDQPLFSQFQAISPTFGVKKINFPSFNSNDKQKEFLEINSSMIASGIKSKTQDNLVKKTVYSQHHTYIPPQLHYQEKLKTESSGPHQKNVFTSNRNNISYMSVLKPHQSSNLSKKSFPKYFQQRQQAKSTNKYNQKVIQHRQASQFNKQKAFDQPGKSIVNKTPFKQMIYPQNTLINKPQYSSNQIIESHSDVKMTKFKSEFQDQRRKIPSTLSYKAKYSFNVQKKKSIQSNINVFFDNDSHDSFKEKALEGAGGDKKANGGNKKDFKHTKGNSCFNQYGNDKMADSEKKPRVQSTKAQRQKEFQRSNEKKFTFGCKPVFGAIEQIRPYEIGKQKSGFHVKKAEQTLPRTTADQDERKMLFKTARTSQIIEFDELHRSDPGKIVHKDIDHEGNILMMKLPSQVKRFKKWQPAINVYGSLINVSYHGLKNVKQNSQSSVATSGGIRPTDQSKFEKNIVSKLVCQAQSTQKVRKQVMQDYKGLFSDDLALDRQKHQKQQQQKQQIQKQQATRRRIRQQAMLLQNTSSKDLLIQQKVQRQREKHAQLKSDLSRLFTQQ